jgi:serine protease Do
VNRVPVILPLLAVLAFATTGCATVTGSQDRAVLRARDQVAPALVHIRPVREVFRRGEREEMVVVGSGFIISPEGYVVTNEHVAGDKSTLVRCVLSDKEEIEAEVVGSDPFTDIAVLKLKGKPGQRFPFVRMGDSSTLEAGQTVMALGSPHGLARSVSLGIVSVTDRYLGGADQDRAPYNNWIQTDAAINPGNSGGPLVNLRGEVVGVNARKLTGADNVGFAIPINIAREVVEDIMDNGRVERSWFGVTLQATTSITDNPGRQGVVIGSVDPYSPSAQAGLRPGDMLQAVNGVTVNARFEEELPAVRKRIADLPIGEPASLLVERGGETLEIEILTIEKSELRGDERALERWGCTVTEVTPELMARARLTERMGAFVSGAREGGPASNAGLSAGDIILAMDGEPVRSLAHFLELYEEVTESGRELVLMDVKRGALTRFVLLKQGATSGLIPQLEQ